MKPGDYVQLVHRIPRWPRQTRGTVRRVTADGWVHVELPMGGYLEAREDELVRLLRRSEIGRQ